jgi:hypothetical protein
MSARYLDIREYADVRTAGDPICMEKNPMIRTIQWLATAILTAAGIALLCAPDRVSTVQGKSETPAAHAAAAQTLVL